MAYQTKAIHNYHFHFAKLIVQEFLEEALQTLDRIANAPAFGLQENGLAAMDVVIHGGGKGGSLSLGVPALGEELKEEKETVVEARRALREERKALDSEQKEFDLIKSKLESDRHKCDRDREKLNAQLDAAKATAASLETARKAVEKEAASLEKERERRETEAVKLEEQVRVYLYFHPYGQLY